MHTILDRRQALSMLAAGAAAPLLPTIFPIGVFGREAEHARYKSPYHLAFTFKREELIGDLKNSERGDPRRESTTAHEHWYSEKTRHKFGAWGPEQRRYIKLPGLDEKPVEWKRERVLAVGSRFIGYEYQHHHVPDWDPPKHWPWKHCCAGHNGRGVDCSNFTTFVYNQGFGIHMSSGIERQSVVHEALEATGDAEDGRPLVHSRARGWAGHARDYVGRFDRAVAERGAAGDRQLWWGCAR
jgi:hypothetical protein